jgi:ribonuclease P protein component
MREAHVPTEQSQAQEDARIPRPHALARRPGGHQEPPPPRPQATDRLIRRVRGRASFAALSRARRVRRAPVTLRFVPGASDGAAHVAYAVDRRVGSAVSRNRARRRLRAAVAAHADALEPGDYLFGAEPDVVTMPFEQLVSTLGELVTATGADR